MCCAITSSRALALLSRVLAHPLQSLESSAIVLNFGQHPCSFLFFGVEDLETQISVVKGCAISLRYFSTFNCLEPDSVLWRGRELSAREFSGLISFFHN
jgi:hypothetical protein